MAFTSGKQLSMQTAKPRTGIDCQPLSPKDETTLTGAAAFGATENRGARGLGDKMGAFAGLLCGCMPPGRRPMEGPWAGAIRSRLARCLVIARPRSPLTDPTTRRHDQHDRTTRAATMKAKR